jgi:hypothetical protein
MLRAKIFSISGGWGTWVIEDGGQYFRGNIYRQKTDASLLTDRQVAELRKQVEGSDFRIETYST